jgi:glutathione synthase/RimK-type ligase-like ATP-grasp enzyme
MKKILILFGEKSAKSNTPFGDKKYQYCYEYLYSLAREHDLDVYRASYQWYNFKKKAFSHAWTFKDNHWYKVRNIKPDLIYDKTNFNSDTHYFKGKISASYKIINDPDFTLLAGNKLFTSLLFPNYQKKYYRVSSKEELREALKKIKGPMVVLKPAIGSGGKNIKIIKKSEAKFLKIKNEFLAGEFIDSSQGIKGITSKKHDLRLVFIDNKLIYSYIRTPAKGSLLANVSMGGTMKIVEKKDLPPQIFTLIREVQDRFSFFRKKIYTVDLIFDRQQKPWIIELNTMPGIYFTPDQKKWQKKLYLEKINLWKSELQ